MSESQEPTVNQETGAPEASNSPEQASAEQLQKERDDYYDRLLRKTAEFDNYRKRVERERKDFTEWAAADVLSDVLAVMDDLDRALATPAPPEAEPYRAGVELIHKALADLVKKRGVTPIDAVGADFDPHRHQAVAYEAVEGAREGEETGRELLQPRIIGARQRKRPQRPARHRAHGRHVRKVDGQCLVTKGAGIRSREEVGSGHQHVGRYRERHAARGCKQRCVVADSEQRLLRRPCANTLSVSGWSRCHVTWGSGTCLPTRT